MRVRKISQISISGPGAVGAEGVAARNAGTGGGRQWGQPTPTTLKLWERRPPPPTLDCESRSFLVLFMQVNLGLYQKIVGQIQEF